jgi:hypothetical protein
MTFEPKREHLSDLMATDGDVSKHGCGGLHLRASKPLLSFNGTPLLHFCKFATEGLSAAQSRTVRNSLVPIRSQS